MAGQGCAELGPAALSPLGTQEGPRFVPARDGVTTSTELLTDFPCC